MAAYANTPAYDRAAIMRHAWDLVRKANLAKFSLRFLLRNAMHTAWNAAKDERKYGRMRSRPVDPIDLAIRTIEAKERLTPADYAEVARLRRRAA